jgi:hypothetical protein
VRVRQNHTSRRTQAVLFALVVLAGMVFWIGSQSASRANSGGRWLPITLETGTVDGYQWAMGAKLRQHEPLGAICAIVYMREPVSSDAAYVEGTESVGCGNLERPMDSVVESASFGSGDSRLAILTALYRPVVRKAVFLLGEGRRKVFHPRIAKVPKRTARGIPRFRYFVAPFKGETCIRKITLFDGDDHVIYRESSAPCRAEGNL